MGWRLIRVCKHHNIRHENGHNNSYEMMSKLSQSFIREILRKTKNSVKAMIIKKNIFKQMLYT